MAQVYTIPTKFTAIDGMSPVIAKMAGNMHSMVEKANIGLARQERIFRRMVPSLSGAARSLLNYGTAGAGLAAVGFSGKAIVDYETSIASLSAVTGAVGPQLESFKNEIKSLATESKKSAIDVAGSFETIGSMMSQYLDDPKALRQIADAGITLSKASRQDLVPTLQNLTSIMNQFDLKANQATETINRLTAGEIVGSLRTSEVSEALQEFGAGAFAANVNLSESVALVEALAKQMKTDKIGVGARNILTILDSAKGLQKRARKELKHAGVDLKLLMDPTKTLSERLHELSKIQGNSVAITKVFGRENKTAGQVIFNQLAVFDEYLEKIKTTNEAQSQARTNSQTFAASVEELKNAWINYIATNDETTGGLNKLKTAVHYVTNNLDGIVTVGLNAIKVFALWQASILTIKAVTIGWNATMAVTRTIGAALYFADMTKWFAATNGVSIATARLTLLQTSLNAAWAANPIGIVVTALAALAGAIYLVNRRNAELSEQYKKKIDLNIVANVQKEADAVQKLVEKYYALTGSISKANALSIRERKITLDIERQKVEAKVSKLQKELDSNKAGGVSAGGGAGMALWNMFQSNSGTAKQLATEQQKANQIAEQQNYLAQYAREAGRKGVVDYSQMAAVFPSKKADEQTSTPWTESMKGDKKDGGRPFIDYNKMREIFTNSQKITIELVGANGAKITGNGAGGTKVTTPNSF